MDDKIVLLDQLGNEQEFIILGTFGLDDENYAALLPAEDTESSIYILRMEEDRDGGILLIGIEDDEELEAAIDAYEEIQSENLQ
ncbi:MAG TPA: DUF1292 domain-containing protein [Tissierellaceae bacterium]|nr:DUF1292 domain-containing protein [Tissierellaceae bacterium]